MPEHLDHHPWPRIRVTSQVPPVDLLSYAVSAQTGVPSTILGTSQLGLENGGLGHSVMKSFAVMALDAINANLNYTILLDYYCDVPAGKQLAILEETHNKW